MEFLLHNEEGIQFPPIRPAFTEGELFFDRFRALTPRDARDSVIGEGGTGLIHLVRDELMDRVVALKLPHESILRDPSARFDVIRETRQAIELTHPHIVRIHDFHEGRQGWGISMQYVRGKNLDEWRHEGRAGNRRGIVPYPVERIEGWVVQLCDALIYAHEDARMVHRDIKPKNLMLERREDGHEKLLLTDFGITQKLRLHTMMLSRVQPGASDKNTMGTLPYMPWEQIQGAPASTLDDVYAVGATIYELLTGRPPFYEGGYEQIRTQIEKVVPPSMTQRLRDFDLPDHGIPRAWEDTVAACLSKKAEDRPQSVREVVARLGLTSSAAIPVATGGAAAASGPELDALHLDLQQRTEELESLRIELTQDRNRMQALEAESVQSRAAFEAMQAELSRSQAEAAALQATIEQSGGRITELEQAIASHQAALGEAGGRSEALDAELNGLRQSLTLMEAESARWKESYESLEKGLEGEQQEILSRLQADIGEKDRQLAEARGHHDQLQKSLASLEEQRSREQQQRTQLEASLAAAQQAAGASAAEIEQRFQAELDGLRQAVAVAQEQAAGEQQAADARIQEAEASAQQQLQQYEQAAQQQIAQAQESARQQIEEARANAHKITAEAEQNARRQSEQALNEARTQADAAQKEAARTNEEARRATATAESARKELESMKGRQSAPLMPLLYVLLGALVVGGGLGVGLGKFTGKPAASAKQALNLSSYSSSIPDNAGPASAPVTAGLFRAYLADQHIAAADGAKVVPGLDSLDDSAPVTGVSWWVAENFCAWLTSRELGDADRTKGRHFRIASAAEIAKASRGADAPAEWTSDAGDATDSPAGSRKIVTKDAKADGSWQMPSLGAAPGGARLGFRVSLGS